MVCLIVYVRGMMSTDYSEPESKPTIEKDGAGDDAYPGTPNDLHAYPMNGDTHKDHGIWPPIDRLSTISETDNEVRK
jgi:hypothetical protein